MAFLLKDNSVNWRRHVGIVDSIIQRQRRRNRIQSNSCRLRDNAMQCSINGTSLTMRSVFFQVSSCTIFSVHFRVFLRQVGEQYQGRHGKWSLRSKGHLRKLSVLWIKHSSKQKKAIIMKREAVLQWSF